MIRYPRDEDGNIKTKKPCQTPGCNWPNWHVCLVGKPNKMPQIIAEQNSSKRDKRLGLRTESHKEAIAQSQRERWARVREANRAKHQVIISRYAEENVSILMLMNEFNLGRRAISTILSDAEKRGEIKIRKQGHTLAFTAKNALQNN